MTAQPAAAEFDAAERPTFAFCRDANVRRVVGQAFERPGLGESTVVDGGADAALAALRRGEDPSLLLVDLSGTERAADAVQLLAKQARRGMPIIALGGDLPLARFRELIAAGATDYLDHALGPAVLSEAITRARRLRSRRQTDLGPSRLGRVIVLQGARSGIGVTGLAVSTAWTLACVNERNTVLLDLDLSFGTVAFALDIDPGRGLVEALKQPSRIDTMFIERSLVRDGERLAVLSAEEPFDDEPVIDERAAAILIEELRQTFDCIVIDLPARFSPLHKPVLAAASDVVLVTALTLPALRDTLRWLAVLPTLAATAVVKVVAGPTSGNLPQAEFERNLGRKLDLVLPADAKAFDQAANTGKPVAACAPKSPFTRSVGTLTTALGYVPANPAAAAKRLSFGRFALSRG